MQQQLMLDLKFGKRGEYNEIGEKVNAKLSCSVLQIKKLKNVKR